MAAVFAAAAEAPITAITIVFEMSNDYTVILPLMVCTVIATLLGRKLLGNTIYEMKLVRRGIDWARARKPRPFSRVTVRTVEREPAIVGSSSQTVRDIAAQLAHSPESVVPIVDDGAFTGMVTASDVAAALASDPNMTMADLVQRPAMLLSQDDTLEEAAVAMADPDTPLLPVVDPSNGALLGILTRRDVLNAYRSRVDV